MSACAGSILSVGTLLVLDPLSAFPANELEIVGAVLTGTGSAAILSFSGIAFTRTGPQGLLISVAAALLAASAIDFSLLHLPDGVRAPVVSALPIISALLLLDRTKSAGPIPEKTSWSLLANIRKGAGVRTVGLPLAVGLAYGLMQRLVIDAYALESAEVNVATISSFLLSAAFIAVTALFVDSRKLIKLVCFGTVPIIGIAFVALPIFSDSTAVIQAVCVVGFNSFYFMTWALWAENRTDPLFAKRFVLGLFVLVGSESLGSALSVHVITALQESGTALAIVSLVAVYLLLMTGMLSINRETSGLESADRPSHPPDRLSVSAREHATGDWGARFGLSARESEVFELLARGRNRSYISKELFISDNTTRSHMKSIYRKLGIHSQQELIDLIEKGV